MSSPPCCDKIPNLQEGVWVGGGTTNCTGCMGVHKGACIISDQTILERAYRYLWAHLNSEDMARVKQRSSLFLVP